MKAKVVKVAERHKQTGQTSGMVREEAFHSDRTWAGVAHNAPGVIYCGVREAHTPSR